MTSDGIWSDICTDLRGKLDAESFQAWFGKVEVEERKDTLMLWVPSLFHKDWIDNHYKDWIIAVGEKRCGGKFEVRVLCNSEGSRQKKRLAPSTGKPVRSGGRLGTQKIPISPAADFLNSLYTFENFVVGNSNKFAHAACLAVGDQPGRIYNPLFIYGGVGLGKTHLMQAIGHHILRHSPETKIIYVSAENFTNEFINSMKDSRMAAFQKKYRQTEVFLIDDIQFLANKERSQEEFFHTFNELHEAKRQLIISSDRTPKEIPLLEDRLRSRLEWGLITDIKSPDLETRIAILRKKAEESDLDVPDACLDFIAQRVRSNIRELEGVLRRVGAMATFLNRPIDMSLITEAMKDLMESHRDARLGIDQIQKAVADYFKVTIQDLKSKRRTSDVTLPRQVSMYLCREMTGLSLPVIGTEFGGRDHTTVLHSCSKISGLMERDRHMQNIINDIKTSIRGN
jgi:chromosomal replication initiator protein